MSSTSIDGHSQLGDPKDITERPIFEPART
jgi:hypothetical protein